MVSVNTLEQCMLPFVAIALLLSSFAISEKNISEGRVSGKDSDCGQCPPFQSCCRTGVSWPSKKCYLYCLGRYCVDDSECGNNEHCWKHSCKWSRRSPVIGKPCDDDSDCGSDDRIVCCQTCHVCAWKGKCNHTSPTVTILAVLVGVLSLIVLIGIFAICLRSPPRCRNNDEEVPLMRDTAQADPDAHRPLEQHHASFDAQTDQQASPSDPPPQYEKRQTDSARDTGGTRPRELPPPYSSFLEGRSGGASASTSSYGGVSSHWCHRSVTST